MICGFTSGNVVDMTTPEARRHDLYNGSTEFLGPDRADILMAYLPTSEYTDLATKSDLLGTERSLAARIDRVEQRLEAITKRLDRMVLALIAGLIAIITTLVAQSFI